MYDVHRSTVIHTYGESVATRQYNVNGYARSAPACAQLAEPVEQPETARRYPESSGFVPPVLRSPLVHGHPKAGLDEDGVRQSVPPGSATSTRSARSISRSAAGQ